MEKLYQQVRKAQRRLTFQRFVSVLGWCWLTALSAALVLILVDKYVPLGLSAAVWLAGGLVVGLLAAGVWTFATRQKSLEAALEIDRRFGLKERTSSALALPEGVRESEAGQAVVADAVRRVARLEVIEKFPVRPPRQLLFPLAPAAIALLAAWLIHPAGAEDPAAEKPAAKPAPAAVVKAVKGVKKELAQLRKQAGKENLRETDQLLAKLEERTKELIAHPEDREKSLVKLNNLLQELEKRRQQLGGAEKLKEKLDSLRKTDPGPADKFSKALSRGKLQKAAEELKKLQKALENGAMSDKQKEDLAKQVKQMAEKLDKLTKAHQAAQKDLEEQIKKLKQSGQKAEAQKLEKQLQQLQQQNQQMQQLQKMAKNLKKCNQCLKQGNCQQAAQAMNQMQAALNQMQKQQKEMELLDGAEMQIAQAKEQMTCKQCNGQGCPMCQGGGGKEDDKRWTRDALGLGKGRASGARPEAKTETATYDSPVRQKVGPGKASIEGMVEGPNQRPGAATPLAEQGEAEQLTPTDPLSGRQIPRKHRQFAKDYLDQYREGK
ncbi:MAG: hypothetical protein JXB10_17110 [Pirellulales bacterium]|nr:hypothetical protein [Pirellulales bacterium]